MSWSVSSTGAVAEVRSRINSQLDTERARYAGEGATPVMLAEAADIDAAKASINAALDQFTSRPRGEGVAVSAWGSRSTGVAACSMTIKVDQVELAPQSA